MKLYDLVPDQFRTKTLPELLDYFREEGEWHTVETAVINRLDDLQVEDDQIEILVATLRAHGVALAALAEALYRRPQITEFSSQERLPSPDDTGFYVQLEEPGATVALLAPTLEQALSGALTYIKDHS